jgi:hypothetical protein
MEGWVALQLKRFEPLPTTPPAAEQILTYAFPALRSILMSENVDRRVSRSRREALRAAAPARCSTLERSRALTSTPWSLTFRASGVVSMTVLPGIYDGAAGRMQRVLVSGYWAARISFELRDVNRL